MASGSIFFPLSGVQSWKAAVATTADLPATGNTAGDARAVIDVGTVSVWSGSAWITPAGSGTVTSVAMTVPTFLSVAGSPVTTAGTLAVTLATQVMNTIFAGPGSGADATPTFRALVAADIPNLPASIITSGTLAVARGGTNLASGTSGGIVGYTAAGVLASSVLLTASALLLGGGAGATPTPMASLGTTTTVLHGNAAGAPTFGAVSLTADVTGTLGLGNGGTSATTKSGAFDALSPLSASGDILYGGASGTGTRLAKGSDGQYLKLVSGLPAWAAGGGALTNGDVHWVNTGAGHGSVGNKVKCFGNVVQAVTTNGAITYTSDSTNGDKWTINVAGVYGLFQVQEPTATTGATFGFSLNSASTTTNLISLTATQQLGVTSTQPSLEGCIAATFVAAVNDVVRCQDNGTAYSAGVARNQFWIRQLA